MENQNSSSVISIRGLNKFYGDNQVLKNINLDIYPGQVLGYIGPNGAGKSTTVKILTGLISEFEGEVTIFGKDLRLNLLEAKQLIGYVPENADLYDVLTPMEYLGFVGKLYGMKGNIIDERGEKLLKAFGLQENKDQRMDTFSKGMRQKVLIISALIHNPKIIVLDEPLSGLDANAVIMVKEMISLMAKEGKTIFYCSHMMDVVEKVSDRILLINKGEMVADGSFKELKTYHGESLEMIFSKLTGKTDNLQNAEEVLKAFL